MTLQLKTRGAFRNSIPCTGFLNNAIRDKLKQ